MDHHERASRPDGRVHLGRAGYQLSSLASQPEGAECGFGQEPIHLIAEIGRSGDLRPERPGEELAANRLVNQRPVERDMGSPTRKSTPQIRHDGPVGATHEADEIGRFARPT